MTRYGPEISIGKNPNTRNNCDLIILNAGRHSEQSYKSSMHAEEYVPVIEENTIEAIMTAEARNVELERHATYL